VRVKEIHNGKAVWGPVHSNNRTVGKEIDLNNMNEITWTKKELSEIRKLIPNFKTLDAKEVGRRGM